MKKYISYKYDKNHIYNIRMRYEVSIDSKTLRSKCCYMYFNNWQDFLIYYKNIDKKYRHFYEMFNDKIKFFLDIDCDENYNDNEWNDIVDTIKNRLLIFLNNVTNIYDINIIRCESKYIEKEKKRSCHLIVENFNFDTKYCKELYNMFIKEINENLKKYIDSQVYGENRCLRIIGSSKMGSDRTKYDFENIHDISLKHFVSNIDNTIYIELSKFYNNKINLNYKKNINMKIELKTNYNIKNHEYLDYIRIVNDKINNSKPFFKIRKNGIKGNMIIFDLICPYYCKCCNKIHELENPFIIVNKETIDFYCRRNDKPIRMSFN
jgi:hypothetical protein